MERKIAVPTPPGASERKEPMKRKKRYLWMLIGGFVFVAWTAAILLLLRACGVLREETLADTTEKGEPLPVYAETDAEGNAWLPLMDGTAVCIRDAVDKAVLTPDRQRIVVLLTDGTLYVTDRNQTEKTLVAQNAVGFYCIRHGFLFWDENSQ